LKYGGKVFFIQTVPDFPLVGKNTCYSAAQPLAWSGSDFLLIVKIVG